MATVNSSKAAAPAVHTTKAKKFVTVASKLPMHLELQLCTIRDVRVTGQFGATTEQQAVKTGKIYVIRGTGHPVGQTPKGFPKAPEINDPGFALTHGVDADWFADWQEQNKDTDLVRNGLIMAHGQIESLDSMTSEYQKVDSGLGPLDPDGDRRSPRPINSAIQPVKADEDKAAA